MHWEVWDTDTANLLDACKSEAEALALVRELLAKGWPVEDLSLMFEDESRPAETLPPAVTGVELARRAEETAPQRRTA